MTKAEAKKIEDFKEWLKAKCIEHDEVECYDGELFALNQGKSEAYLQAFKKVNELF